LAREVLEEGTALARTVSDLGRLLDHSIDHVRDAQSPLSTPTFGDEHPPDVAGTIRPREQFLADGQHNHVEVAFHLFDRAAVRTCGSFIARHFGKRLVQALCYRFYRRGRGRSLLVVRLRPRGGLPRGSVRETLHTGVAFPRHLGCCERQSRLPHRFIDRDRLPSPALAGWGRLSSTFWYYAVI
jgi:hypothetical protein